MTHDGCGQRCADGHAKSWRLPLAIAGKPSAFACGRPFQMNTSTAIPSVIFWRLIDRSFPQKPIVVLERKRGKQCIWNAGTIRYVNGLAATYDKHSPSPNPMSIITSSPSG